MVLLVAYGYLNRIPLCLLIDFWTRSLHVVFLQSTPADIAVCQSPVNRTGCPTFSVQGYFDRLIAPQLCIAAVQRQREMILMKLIVRSSCLYWSEV